MYVGDAPVPSIKSDEILLRVRATAINRADTLQRKGQYPPPAGASSIMGLEAAGDVVAVGKDAKQFAPQQRVMALLAGGGYAEYAAVPAAHCMPIPNGFTYEQAAAIPETWLTAFQLLHFIANVKAGEYVMVHAVASGVGTSAIQLCNLSGAHPIVSVGSADKLSFCMKLGAAHGVNYKTSNFAEGVSTWLSKRPDSPSGVDIILDCIGAQNVNGNMQVAKQADARWVLYGLMGGPDAEKFSLGTLLRKRIQLTATTLRARPHAYKAALVDAFSKAVLPAFASGRMVPVIDRTFSLTEMSAAHQRMESDLNIGKIVITVP